MKYLFTLLGMVGFQLFAQVNYLPNQFTLQYAGGVGRTVFGVGYQTPSEKLDVSLLYGFVPAAKGGRLDIFSLKASYSPFAIKLAPKLSWSPIRPTVSVSYTTNKYFYAQWPSRYFDDYYWWSSAFRVHAGLQSSVRLKLPARLKMNSVEFYAEWSSNDLYFVSYTNNRKYLSLWDISVLAVGLKLNMKY